MSIVMDAVLSSSLPSALELPAWSVNAPLATLMVAVVVLSASGVKKAPYSP